MPKVVELHSGDEFTTTYPIEELEPLINLNKIEIIKINYAPKKWWKFWEKKKPISYKFRVK